jgi:hypothetical protein
VEFPITNRTWEIGPLRVPTFTDEPWFMCRAWLFIERRDRGPLLTNKGNTLDQGGSGSMEGDLDSV